MVAVSYHGTVNVLQGTIAQAAGPFGRAEWFALLQDEGTRLFVALARDGDDAIALPLTPSAKSLDAMRNWYSFTWQPMLSGDTPDKRLLDALATDLKSQTHHITFAPLPDEDGSTAMLEHAFRKAGWHVQRTQCDLNHVLPVNGRSFEVYRAGLPGPLRTTLKRKASKVDINIITVFYDDNWSIYEAIYAASWKPEEGAPNLLRNFANAEGEAGRLRLGLALHDGKPIAAQFWTVEGGIAYIHKLAHLEAHKSLSAGTILTAALLEHVIDKDKVDLVDFGTGNDPYKAHWMELARPRYRLDCLDPAQLAAWPLLARQFAARVARALRRS